MKLAFRVGKREGDGQDALVDVEPRGGCSAHSALRSAGLKKPRGGLNAPDIQPLGEGRLRLGSSGRVSPIQIPRKGNCISVGVWQGEKRFLDF